MSASNQTEQRANQLRLRLGKGRLSIVGRRGVTATSSDEHIQAAQARLKAAQETEERAHLALRERMLEALDTTEALSALETAKEHVRQASRVLGELKGAAGHQRADDRFSE